LDLKQSIFGVLNAPVRKDQRHACERSYRYCLIIGEQEEERCTSEGVGICLAFPHSGFCGQSYAITFLFFCLRRATVARCRSAVIERFSLLGCSFRFLFSTRGLQGNRHVDWREHLLRRRIYSRASTMSNKISNTESSVHACNKCWQFCRKSVDVGLVVVSTQEWIICHDRRCALSILCPHIYFVESPHQTDWTRPFEPLGCSALSLFFR